MRHWLYRLRNRGGRGVELWRSARRINTQAGERRGAVCCGRRILNPECPGRAGWTHTPLGKLVLHRRVALSSRAQPARQQAGCAPPAKRLTTSTCDRINQLLKITQVLARFDGDGARPLAAGRQAALRGSNHRAVRLQSELSNFRFSFLVLV